VVVEDRIYPFTEGLPKNGSASVIPYPARVTGVEDIDEKLSPVIVTPD
jgi:hypothetical protein